MATKKKKVPTRTEVFDDFLDEGEEQKAATPTSRAQQSGSSSSSLDTSGWFETEQRKPRRVAMTFTLDPKVINLIEQAADKHKLSRSRIVEKIAFNTLVD